MNFKNRVLLTYAAILLLLAALSACSGEMVYAQPAITESTQYSVPVPSRTAQFTSQPPTSTHEPAIEPQTAVPGTALPLLEWAELMNPAYPNEQAANGMVQLTDGVSQQFLPGDRKVYFQLSHLRLLVDLDGDKSEDALVFLMVDSGGPGTVYYLNAVLNRGGSPRPAASLRLGEQIFLRSLSAADGIIELVMDSVGEEDYS